MASDPLFPQQLDEVVPDGLIGAEACGFRADFTAYAFKLFDEFWHGCAEFVSNSKHCASGRNSYVIDKGAYLGV